MKFLFRILLLAALVPAVAACSSKRPSVAAGQQPDGASILYGHQDDLVYGHSWVVTDIETDNLERSDVKDVAGRYPAVVGFDLGGIELGNPSNLDGVPFDLMRRAALKHIERGGMVTFSWHPRNPLTGGDAWDVSSDQVVASILTGGSKYDEFQLWLRRASDFIESLGGVPVLFRPWHENLGSWFWWGGKLCTADQYKALYQRTHDYFVNERGLKGISWCYSPNGPVSADDYLSRYPGDDYVDYLGTDIYEYVGPLGQEAAGRHFSAQVTEMLTTLKTLGEGHGKKWCLSETGLEGLKDPHWWDQVLYPAIKGTGITYVLTWRNAHDKPEHFYAPWKGFEHEEDFRQFAGHDDIVLL